MKTTKQIIKEVKEKREKGKIDMVIISFGRYFSLNFNDRTIKEITLKEAFGFDFFDWGLNYAIMGDTNKIKYKNVRGLDGCGLFKYFNKQNDLLKMNKELLKEQNLIIKENLDKK